MLKSLAFLLLASFILSVSGANLPALNTANLRKLFESVKPLADLSNAFYSVKGLELLGDSLPATARQDVCNLVRTKVEKASLESVYYATSLDCGVPASDFQATLNAGISSTTVPDLYYYAFASKNLKLAVDSQKLTKSLIDALRVDASIINQAYSLHIASLLSNEDAKKFYDNIEDVLEQADEADKTFLQYEGGVGTTSLVLEGILLLGEKFDQLPAKFDQQRLAKFVNYLSSKRFPTNIKSGYFLLRNAVKLTNNKFAVPLILNRLSSIRVTPSESNVLVSVTNLLGGPVKQTEFNLEGESSNLLANKKVLFTSKSSDRTTFDVKLLEQNQQPAAGFYKVTVNLLLKAGEKQFFLVDNKVDVKVATTVSLVDVQLGVTDREQASPKLTRLEDNGRLKLEADQLSKLTLKFAVKDKTKGNLLEVHQAFVKFTETSSRREIIFLAQAGLSKQYTAEIDFSANAKNFLHASGQYTVELIVSDSLVDNRVLWTLADLKLQFAEVEQPSSGVDKASLYSKRPEIQHLFRQPEPMPSKVVSTIFTVLCAAPLVLLVVMWLGIGFNLSRFSFSLSGLVFHLSLVAIFGLFYCYWIQLNMFQTVRYLALLGLVAFVSGNKLLKSLALNKDKKL